MRGSKEIRSGMWDEIILSDLYTQFFTVRMRDVLKSMAG